MGWRSFLSTSSETSARKDAGHQDADQHVQVDDRPDRSGRHQEIVIALTGHLESVYRSHLEAPDTAGDIAFDPHLDLYEAGYLDSISASEFLLLAEEQYGIELPDWLLGGQANSLSALAAYIEGEIARTKS